MAELGSTRQDLVALLLRRSRQRLAELRQLGFHNEDPDIWPSLRRHVIAAEERIITDKALFRRIARLVIFITTALAFAVVIPLAQALPKNLDSMDAYLAFSIIGSITLSILVILAMRLGRPGQIMPYVPALILAIVCPITNQLIGSLLKDWIQLGILQAVVTGIFLGAIYFLVWIYSTVLLLNLWSNIYWRQARKKEPDTIVVDRLARVLVIGSVEQEWLDLDAKQDIIRSLELAAKAMEQGFPATFESGDFATAHWVTEQADSSAAYLRGLKRWIVAPRCDTRKEFLRTITDLLASCLRGHWGVLRADDIAPLKRPRLLHRISSVTRMLFAGLAPLAAVLILINEELIKPPISTSLLTITGLLAAITFLHVIDPGLTERVGSTKEIAEFLRQE